MSFIARSAMSAARAARPVAVRGARNHGTSPQEIFEAKEAWFKVSIAATAFIALPYTAFTVVKELSHEHHEKVDFSHMHQRHKAFPWGNGDCALFDRCEPHH